MLKKEVVRLKRELGAVSAQDDFAKWAKLRRQHDKAMSEFEKIGTDNLSCFFVQPSRLCQEIVHLCIVTTDGSLRTHQATFTSTISTLRWLGTNGLRFVLQFWFAKSPMFWIPAGWVPYYVEWILSFPRAPLGSVSINVWGIACASMISLVAEAMAAVWVLATRKPVPVGKETGEPMAFKAEEKKEL